MYKIFLSFICMFLLFGCRPYRVDVQQGNFIDTQTLSQLHAGMSKSEVSLLLGSPVLVDPFDSDVWLYAYTEQKNGGIIKKKKLTLRFKHDKLIWQT